MTRLDLTEHFILALKLKAEVERVCALLDEKDARIAALESKLAERKRDYAEGVHRDTQVIGDLRAELAVHARADAHIQETILKLESELAAKVGYDTWMNAAKKLGAELDEERQECELKHAALMGCEETLRDVTGQRDRERSRREALERKVRTLGEFWREGGHAPTGSSSIGQLKACGRELLTILDRAGEQDSTGSGSGDAVPPDGARDSALSPQPEPRRDCAEVMRIAKRVWGEVHGGSLDSLHAVAKELDKAIKRYDNDPCVISGVYPSKPHTPDAEAFVMTGDKTCRDCGFVPCERHKTPPISESHLNEVRAKCFEEAAKMAREDAIEKHKTGSIQGGMGESSIAVDYWTKRDALQDFADELQERAAAVRRGEA